MRGGFFLLLLCFEIVSAHNLASVDERARVHYFNEIL